jgi:hypothetical protein
MMSPFTRLSERRGRERRSACPGRVRQYRDMGQMIVSRSHESHIDGQVKHYKGAFSLSGVVLQTFHTRSETDKIDYAFTCTSQMPILDFGTTSLSRPTNSSISHFAASNRTHLGKTCAISLHLLIRFPEPASPMLTFVPYSITPRGSSAKIGPSTFHLICVVRASAGTAGNFLGDGKELFPWSGWRFRWSKLSIIR